MVTWGQNVTHIIAGRNDAASTSAFGTPATPSTGFSFGSSPAPATSGGLFGSPAPTTGGLFGSPAPAPSIFGSPAPTPVGGGGLFGAPAPSGGSLFGTPAPSGGGLFGAPAPAPFSGLSFGTATSASTLGVTSQATSTYSNPQVPAQAALQAHMDASARQEEARIQSQLDYLYKAYTGTLPAEDDSVHKLKQLQSTSSPFVSILYNPASSEIRQAQLVQGLGLDGRPRPILPPRPPQVSQRDWELAVVQNPNIVEFMPIALVGTPSLQARLSSQQEQSNLALEYSSTVLDTAEQLDQSLARCQIRLEQLQNSQKQLKSRLLNVMRKVEMARCYRLPLSADEHRAFSQLAQLADSVKRICADVVPILDQATPSSSTSLVLKQPQEVIPPSDPGTLKKVLIEHREVLAESIKAIQTDMKDMTLIKKRLEEAIATK